MNMKNELCYMKSENVEPFYFALTKQNSFFMIRR